MRHQIHPGVFGIVLAILAGPLCQAANEALPSLSTSPTAQAQTLFRAGRLSETERLLRAALETSPDDGAWCLTGELRYRLGDFAGARQAFDEAAALNPDNARAWWGLGRLELLFFRRGAARDLFARAYRLDSRDPEILLSYLDFVGDPAARTILLQNLVAVSRRTAPGIAEQAQARLEIEARLGGREPGALAGPYIPYRIQLAGFRPDGSRQRGWVVSATFNGGRPLRLILDTGTRGMMIGRKAARNLALEPLAASRVSGFGENESADGALMLAQRVSIGKLEMRDCLINVGREVPPGADGIIGLNLFERFLIRIEPGSRTLELIPRGEDGPPSPTRTEGALNLAGLLLLRADMPCGRQGWFLLDTGAAFTVVAADAAAAAAANRTGAVPLSGVQGGTEAYRLPPLSFRTAGRTFADPDAIALDLGTLSRREGVEITGILGYSALGHWPLTIDLRNGAVRIGGTPPEAGARSGK
jgi:tetratricopeptide (TPR) repeat protein